jgi:PAS domain S-box-containing protein
MNNKLPSQQIRFKKPRYKRDDAMMLFDQEGHITGWSEGAQRLYGYTASEIIGHHCSCFFPSGEKHLREPCKIMKEDLEAEGWRVSKGGSRFWVRVTRRAILDGSGQAIGFAEFSERKRPEENVVPLYSALENEFILAAFQELKISLDKLRLQLSHLLRIARYEDTGQMVPRERLIRLINRATSESQNILRGLDGLLDVCELSSEKLNVELGEVNLTELVQKLLPTLQLELFRMQHPFAFVAEVSTSGRWDRSMLEKAISALLSYALQTNTPLKLQIRTNQDTTSLTIQCEGARLLPGELALGSRLWIARQIVRAHSGELQMKQMPEGILISIELPRTPQKII